jgi:hypothetical protein
MPSRLIILKVSASRSSGRDAIYLLHDFDNVIFRISNASDPALLQEVESLEKIAQIRRVRSGLIWN